MTTPFIPQYTERQNRALRRMIDFLAASQTRTKSCYQHLRTFDRKSFQDQIVVCPTDASDPEPRLTHPSSFPAWAYNLSQGGIGFVALPLIGQDAVFLGIRKPDGSVRWLTGRVVRARALPEEEFIDYGVAFQSLSKPREGGQQPVMAGPPPI